VLELKFLKFNNVAYVPIVLLMVVNYADELCSNVDQFLKDQFVRCLSNSLGHHPFVFLADMTYPLCVVFMVTGGFYSSVRRTSGSDISYRA
jgi:hypothetical protein